MADCGQTLFHNWANVSWYPGSGLSGHKASPVGRANTRQSPDYVSRLGQRRIRLTSIEPAMGCDAGPSLNRYRVGKPTLCVPGTSHRRVHWLISGGGGRNRLVMKKLSSQVEICCRSHSDLMHCHSLMSTLFIADRHSDGRRNKWVSFAPLLFNIYNKCVKGLEFTCHTTNVRNFVAMPEICYRSLTVMPVCLHCLSLTFTTSVAEISLSFIFSIFI